MPNDIGADLTDLEQRLHSVEQDTPIVRAPGVTVAPNAAGVMTVYDSLTFNTGWANHTKMQIGTPNTWVHYTGAATPWGGATATRIGSMCFLNGLLVRTGADLAAGTTHNLRMFMLPVGWRPSIQWVFSCPSSIGGNPGSVRIDIYPDTTSAAGGVYYAYGPAILATNSWIGLQCAFPIVDAPGP